MSNVSSAVTYMSVYTDYEPWRYYREESAETRPPRVIVYGYDGLHMQPVAPPSLDYVPGPEHPSSPDYVPIPEHPPSPVEIPYAPEPEYPEYLEPSDDEVPLKYQPLPADASPITASPDYVADFNLKEDLEDDQADYPTDEGDGNDEPSDDDEDDDDIDSDPEEEPFKDEEDDEEEEEYLAPADPTDVSIVDPVLPAGDTKELEADEKTPTPRSPHIIIPLSQTPLHRARKTVRPEPSMSASMEACIARHAALLSPPLHLPSPPLPLPSSLTTSPTDTGVPLGYRESFAASAARQPGPTESDLRRYRVERADREAMYAHKAWVGSEDRSSAIVTHVGTLEAHVASLIAQTSSLQSRLTTTLGRIKILDAKDQEPQEGPAEAGSSWLSCMVINKMAPKKRTTRATPATKTTPTTTVTNAQLQALIERGVAAALAERDADRSMNGDNINDSGIGGRRQMMTPRECTYTDFLKCQPMSFHGTEGVVGLTR
nr:hypothetical protein [Tanacetum cinerariifolium]